MIRGKQLESRAMRRRVQSNAGRQGGRPRRAVAKPEDVIHHRGAPRAHTQGRLVPGVANVRWAGHRPPTQEFSAVIHAEL